MADCEEYNCDCESINSAIDSYNSAVDAFASSIGGMTNLPDQLKSILQDVNTKLKNTDAALPDGTKGDCDDCGGIGGINALIKKAFPTRQGNKNKNHPGELGNITRAGSDLSSVYRSCCGGGESNPLKPFEDTGGPQVGGPCGRAGDSVENAPLFSCDPLPPPDGIDSDYDTIKIPKLECKPKDNAGACQDGKGGVSLETKDGAEIKIPKLKAGIGALSKRITDLNKYIKGVNKLASQTQNSGGANGSLKDEACLTRLLDLMCSGQLKGGNPGVSDAVRPGTKIPNSACGISGCTANSFHCCHQLMNEISKKTLTYGHTSNDPNGKAWNAKPNCGPEDAMTSKGMAYVGPGQSAGDAVTARMAQLAAAFPGGCGNQDGSTPPRPPKPLPARINCDGANCPCKDGVPQTLSDAKRKELYDLQKRLADLRTERTGLETEKTVKTNAMDSLQQQLETRKKAGVSDADLAPIRNAIEQMSFRISRIVVSINALNTEEPVVQNGISIILNGVNIEPGSYCVEFEYYYCPANSTPRDGGGQETNTNDQDAGRLHRNFFEMFNNIQRTMDSLASELDCKNPITPHLADCFGDQSGAKSPFPKGVPGNPNTKNNSNTLPPGAPCAENDNVQELGSWFYPDCNGSVGDPPRAKSDQPRANCVQKLFRIMKNWVNSTSKLEGKLSNLEKGIGDLDKAMTEITKLSADITVNSQDSPCKGFKTDDVVKKLESVTEAVDNAQRALESLNSIKDKF
jgi:prefoldin subunit 5